MAEHTAGIMGPSYGPETKCHPGCVPLCDFCQFYKFNPGPHGEYTGNGWCDYSQQQRDPENACEDFWCQNVPLHVAMDRLIELRAQD
jgi:hypothetical protein